MTFRSPPPARARGLAGAVAAAAVIALAAPVRGPRCQTPDEDARSVAWFVANQPERVHALFSTLNLNRPGLGDVRSAAAAKDYPAACDALLAYYRTTPAAKRARRAPAAASDRTDPRADTILADQFSFYNVAGTLPRDRLGAIDWSYDGPENDDLWNWSLNELDYMSTLTGAYLRTGRREYAARVDTDVRDWILANPYPGRATQRGRWRGITTAARARAWSAVFYGLQACDEFSPAARLLMLSSVAEHAQYLLLFHRRDAGYWTLTELEGLATVGTAWPEFDDAPGWRAFAMERMGTLMTDQVYPDGVHVELGSGYHRITLEHFEKFLDVFREFGHAVPDSADAGVQKMWSYLALTLRPDGTTPENGDSDRRDIREQLLAAAKEHDRPDWIHIATGGRSGVAPAAGPSVAFPWAGQFVMRSGWDADAQWSFFDIGPYGTHHQHRDMLHLSIDAHGRALLVDAGRFHYARDPLRDYFTGSAAHNVIRIDGADQNAGPERAGDPIAAADYGAREDWDYVRGMFSAGYAGVEGQAIHTRVVIYVHDRFWVVADRIETDRPRRVEALWHFAPDCTAVLEGRSVVTTDEGKGNLRVVPVGGVPWSAEIVAGREDPSIQGWYSGVYNEKVPAPVAVYSAELPGTTTLVWVLRAGRGAVPAPDATIISSRPERVEVRVRVDPGESFLITVPMNAWRPDVRRE